MGDSLEEVVAAVLAVVQVLAAGASTTLVVARGFPSGLEAASELLLEVELLVALAWELVVGLGWGLVVEEVGLVVVELVAALGWGLVVEVVDLAWVEALVGLAMVVVMEVVEGLALVDWGAWEDSLQGWEVVGTLQDFLEAHLEWVQSKK